MRTRLLCGVMDWQEDSGKFISKKLNNGDWDYWLVLDFVNMDELAPELGNHKYQVSILAVSPQAAQNKIKAALDCCGFNPECRNSESTVIEALLDYGVYATLQTFTGNNYHKVLQKAKTQLDCVASLFGFFMDRPENRLGHTGWDFITGDLSLDKVM